MIRSASFDRLTLDFTHSLHSRAFLVSLTIVVRLATMGLNFHGNETVESWEDVAIAENIIEGQGYSIDNNWRYRMLYYFVRSDVKDPEPDGYRPTTLKPPLYPFVLVFFFSAFGVGHFVPILVFNCLLAGAAVYCLNGVLRRQSRGIAYVASLAFALYPPFVYHSATTVESTWLAVFLMLAVLMQVHRLSVSTDSRWLLLGATGGLLVMTNPVFVLAVGATGCLTGLAIATTPTRQLRYLAVFVFGLSLCVGPWILRNYLLFGDLVMKSAVGHTLLKARETSGDPLWVSSSEVLKVEAAGRRLNEVEEDALLKRLVLPAVMTNKLEFLKSIAKNFVQLWWQPHRYTGNYSLNYLIGRKLPYAVLLIVSLLPMLMALTRFVNSPLYYFRSDTIMAFALIFIISDTIAFSLFGAWNIRYHLPSEVLMLPFFATGCMAMSDLARRTLLPRRRAVVLEA